MCSHFTSPASLPGAWDMVPVGWSTCTGPADKTWGLWDTKGHPLKHHGWHWVPEFGQWLPHCLETAVQFPALSYPDAMFYPEMAAAWFRMDWIPAPHIDKHLPNPSFSFNCKPSTNGPNPTNTDCIGKERWVLSGSLAQAQHLHLWVGISMWKSESPVSTETIVRKYLFIDYSLIYLTFLVIIPCYIYLFHFALVVSVISSKAASNTLMFLWILERIKYYWKNKISKEILAPLMYLVLKIPIYVTCQESSSNLIFFN